MSKTIKISKGATIKISGQAQPSSEALQSDTYVIKPTDFHGLRAKLLVKPGDEVKAGSPLFYDKDHEQIKFTSPVSGEIAEINRGEKRVLLEIKILADKEVKYESFNVSTDSRESVLEGILESGLWPNIRQRPYDVIADPATEPKAIHISCFDSSPLAADFGYVVDGKSAEFQKGVEALGKLTNGKVHLNVPASGASSVFTSTKGAQINKVSGPHPAGNVGVQIHHIDPINKGDKVWTLDVQAVVQIGTLFLKGIYDSSKVVALAGPHATKPQYFSTRVGSSVKNMLAGNLVEAKSRIISGSIFTGTQIAEDGYIGFYDSTVIAIEEGDSPEFLGWLNPGLTRKAHSRAYLGWLSPLKKAELNTNNHGEERAFVVTGQYEKVFPMKIFPVQLIKSIMVEDIERMENLGIYEVAPEDFGLCEYVCTSKMNLQKIVRGGLDLMKQEVG